MNTGFRPTQWLIISFATKLALAQTFLAYILYKLYDYHMVTVTQSQFRAQQSECLALAQREPVEITSRGAKRRAVVVSPDFYERALQALEDRADIAAAQAARLENDRISLADLKAELSI